MRSVHILAAPRESELSEIRVAFDEGRVGAVVLAAAAGVGKTRLAREALVALAGSQAAPSCARCWGPHGSRTSPP